MGDARRKWFPRSPLLRLLVAWLGAGTVVALLMELRASWETRAILREPIPAVSLQGVDAKTALQRFADSADGRFALSMCPDVAARPLTLHTDQPMPFEEFVTLV